MITSDCSSHWHQGECTLKKKILPCISLSQIVDSIQYLEGPNVSEAPMIGARQYFFFRVLDTWHLSEWEFNNSREISCTLQQSHFFRANMQGQTFLRHPKMAEQVSNFDWKPQLELQGHECSSNWFVEIQSIINLEIVWLKELSKNNGLLEKSWMCGPQRSYLQDKKKPLGVEKLWNFEFCLGLGFFTH